MAQSTEHEYDVVILGGGPAGSSAAAVLAEAGRRVAVLEKEQFPRYHIGESLVPFCYFPLERLGLIEKMRASSYVRKYSVQFVGQSGRVSTPFYFSQHTDHPCAMTWQVERADFDDMLLANAREKGAEVFFETAAKGLLREGGERGRVTGVRAERKDGGEMIFRASLTIDATGREALTVARHGWRVFDPNLNKIAIWSYWDSAMRDPGMDEGATTVAYLPEKGWFWYIPLQNGRVSVGVVAERAYLYRGTRDAGEIMAREIKLNKWVKDHLAPGKQSGPYRATGEFSYRSKYCADDGLILAGDAFAFLDPVFSSGVLLALKSGVMAGEAADAALNAGRYDAAQFNAYGEQLCNGIESMRRLVYAFYDRNFHFKQLIMSYPNLRGDLTDCLIGDLFRDFEKLFGAVAEFAAVPSALPHGRARSPAEEASCESSS